MLSVTASLYSSAAHTPPANLRAMAAVLRMRHFVCHGCYRRPWLGLRENKYMLNTVVCCAERLCPSRYPIYDGHQLKSDIQNLDLLF